MRLRYTPRALAELEAILKSIATVSPQGALAVRRRIKTIADILRERPHAGQRVGKTGMRRVVANPYPYLVFYRATDDEIIVVGVRHGARNPSSIPSQ
jgi:toxin ParE1/3/4